MATEATGETIAELVKEGHVLIDFWGPDCAPCMAMMPAVEALGEKYAGQVMLLKVKAPDNRQVCRDMRVAGLPTYITLRDGGEVERVTGNGATIDDIEAAIQRLLAGAPVTGLPVPEHLR